MSLWRTIAGRFRAPMLMDSMFARLAVRRPLLERPDGPEALRQAAIRCMACGDGKACEAWLEENDAPDAPPPYCRNADLIERLRRETRIAH